MNWKELKNSIEKKREKRKKYFSGNQDEILTFNLRVFKNLSVVSFLCIVIYIIITSFFIAEWQSSLFYNTMLIACSAVFIIIAFYINKHRLKHKVVEKIACTVFALCLFLLLIDFDTIAAPASSQKFSSAFLVIAPIIFIMNGSRMIIDEMFFVVIYALSAFRYKELYYAKNDMYSIFAGFLLGLIAYVITMDLRLRTNSEVLLLKHFSEIDELTKIKNRRAANAQISYMLSERKEDSKCALMILDVDYFKKINDTYGHKIGDLILSEVAKVLSETFRKTDVVSRFGGDEFTVFMDGFSEELFLKRKCLEIQKKVHDIRNNEFHVSCSIGVCILSGGNHSMDDMFQVADQALYETKNRQRGTYSIHVIH